ncbi:MAG: hypothetical protein QOG56_172 [Solirubrobacteraceae bacterium]|nr:hypothetical protein [Solirubrobacteraceae bacterium]
MPTPRQNVHQLVFEWVRRRPHASAVHDPAAGRELTYAQLWEQSGLVADALRAHGLSHGDVVAVEMPRCADLVVALLAIVRAGAAYLPLDAHAPADRTAGILADARATLTLHAEPGAPPQDTGRLSVPALLASPPAPRDAAVPAATVDRDDAMYVAYTSGSTGRPKGVVVPHRAVIRLVVAPNYCTIAPGARVANASNPAFDATTFEMWGALTAGAAVVVLPTVTDLDLDDWIALVVAQRITTMFLTTSLFHIVARERPSAFATLDTLVVGGEQLDAEMARRVLAAKAPRHLVNGYGPTETTTFATAYACTAANLAGCRRTPIGVALQDTRLLVLDDRLRPVERGEPGELCIGGPGVALGYLRRPELTAQRFVPEPGGDGTMYRTGDVVRELPDGALELLGRRDRQVKLRGFRIELEEIEVAATETGLADAAFVEKVGEGPAALLVAFVLPARGARERDGELPAALEAALASRLPSYMIPTRWIVLAELPLGPTGKVDRAALAARLERPAQQSAPAAPDDRVRAHLWAILHELLGHAEILPRDHFLDLGGNSILAIQTASRLREQLTVEIEPGDVLLAESVGELAERVRELQAVAS